MFVARDPPYGMNERFPSFTLSGEHFTAFRRNAIEPSVATPTPLDPSPFDPSASFEPVQQRVHGGSLEAQCPLRSRLDQLTQVVSVARLAFHQRKNQQLGAAFLQFAVEHARQLILHSDIVLKGILRRQCGIARMKTSADCADVAD